MFRYEGIHEEMLVCTLREVPFRLCCSLGSPLRHRLGLCESLLVCVWKRGNKKLTLGASLGVER